MAAKHGSSLSERIAAASRGLVYISETDSEVEVFKAGKFPDAGPENFRRAIAADGEEIAAADPHEFLARLSAVRDWHTDRDAANAAGWRSLARLLAAELTELRLYRVGRVRVRIFVVGLDKKGRMRGVTMRAVET